MVAMSSALVSCQSDEQEAQGHDGLAPITLTSGIITRSIDQNLQQTQINEGVKVGVFVVNNSSDNSLLYDNTAITADGSGGFTGNTMTYPTDEEATVGIYAYAPYNSSWSASLNADNQFTVAADQSENAGYLASDLLRGVPEGENSFNSASGSVALKFKHMLSKLNINFDMGETGIDLKGATVRVTNTLPTTTLNVYAGTMGNAQGTTQPVVAAKFADDATTFTASAVVVPQTVLGNETLVQVQLADGTTYDAELNSDVTFESGKKYSYTVKFDGSGADEPAVTLELTGVIDDWEDGNQDLTGDVGEVVKYGVGDYITSDGTFLKASELNEENKPAVVAVIFSENVSSTDAAEGYNAYAMGVERFGNKAWGFTDAIENGCPTFAEALANLDGRTKTATILGSEYYVEENSFVNYSNYSISHKLPEGTSGWFTPSFGQMMQILNNLGGAGITASTTITDQSGDVMYTSSDIAPINKVNSYLTAIGADPIFVTNESSTTYITVTENAANSWTNCWCVQTKNADWSFGKNAGKDKGGRSVIPCVAVKLPVE